MPTNTMIRNAEVVAGMSPLAHKPNEPLSSYLNKWIIYDILPEIIIIYIEHATSNQALDEFIFCKYSIDHIFIIIKTPTTNKIKPKIIFKRITFWAFSPKPVYVPTQIAV